MVFMMSLSWLPLLQLKRKGLSAEKEHTNGGELAL